MDTHNPLKGKYKSTDVDFIPGCTGKVPYFSEGMVRDIIRKFKPNTRRQPRAYHCDKNTILQGHWHISTQGKGKSYRGAG